MVCPSETALLDALERGFSGQSGGEIELHLSRCVACAEAAASIVRMGWHRSHGRSTAPELTNSGVHDEVGAGECEAVDEFGQRAPESTHDGRYIRVKPIAHGAMGVVWSGYDPELDRKVAIKLVSVRRADAAHEEARALARVAHPNVVPVYDALLLEQRLAIVMEFVSGTTLREWMRNPQSNKEIIDVFLAVGRGLEAVHEAGLVHRDFKPENVLIGTDDRPRVVDFGLARVTDDGDAAIERAGTPAYMAPEQYRGEATPQSDQFAFCVSLWEALCGERPFGGEGAASATPRELRPIPTGVHLPADVRQALQRGLSTDPGDRWPSMDALLRVLSRDPSKRRARWVAGAVVVLTMTLGVGAWWRAQAEQCTGAAEAFAGVWDEGRRAQIEEAVLATSASFAPGVWERVAPQLDTWAQDWVAMHTETCEATRRYAEQSEVVMDLRMACLHHAKLDFVATTDVLAEATQPVVENAHELVGALPALTRCADVQALQAAVPLPDPDEAGAVDAIRAELAHARARREAGDYDAAMAAAREAEALAAETVYAPIRTDVLVELGTIQGATGRYDEAEATLGEAQRHAVRWKQFDAAVEATAVLIHIVGYLERRHAEALALRNLALGLASDNADGEAQVRNSMGNVMVGLGELERAEEEYRAVLRLYEATHGATDPRVAVLRNNLGGVLHARGRYDEAASEHRAALAIRLEALGPEHPHVAQSRYNLANALAELGRFAEAEKEQRLALELRKRALGPDHPFVAENRRKLGGVLRAQGRYAEAEAETRAALAISLKSLGESHPEVAASRNNLGTILREQGKLDEAEAEFRAALASRLEALGVEHSDVLHTRNNLANVLYARGAYASARAEHWAVLEARERTLGPEHPNVATSRNNLGIALLQLGRIEEAEREIRAALAAREKALGPDHAIVATSRHNLAKVLLARGDLATAEAQERAALEVRRRVLGADHPHVASSRHGLAEILREQGKLEEAEREHRAALEIREKLPDPDPMAVATSLLGLGRTLIARNRELEAIALLERASEMLDDENVPHELRAQALFVLAQASWSQTRLRERAKERALRALELYREDREPEPEAIESVERWIRAHP